MNRIIACVLFVLCKGISSLFELGTSYFYTGSHLEFGTADFFYTDGPRILLIRRNSKGEIAGHSLTSIFTFRFVLKNGIPSSVEMVVFSRRIHDLLFIGNEKAYEAYDTYILLPERLKYSDWPLAGMA